MPTQKKLTHQQKRRLAEQQIQIADGDDHNQSKGLVIAHLGETLTVESQEGLVVRCHARKNCPALAVGDEVMWIPDPQMQPQHPEHTQGVITALLPRTSVLSRTVREKKTKPIAANLDQLLIVIAPEPSAQAYLIDQLIVTAELAKLGVILIANKIDLLPNPVFEALISLYTQIGYPVLHISRHLPDSRLALIAYLDQKRSILAGQSGVGKSSILKTVIPQETILIGPLSDRTQHGCHTTSYSKLYHFSIGAAQGDIIDAPGIREMGIRHLTPDDLIRGFIELQSRLGHCRFTNCTHTHEPDCGIQSALKTGEISTQRWQSYLQLKNTLG
jgi:ribosome biogenesis GTPase